MKKFLKEDFIKLYDEEYCLRIVNEYPYNLKFVKNQTPEICLKAVAQHQDAIYYVNKEYLYLFEDMLED